MKIIESCYTFLIILSLVFISCDNGEKTKIANSFKIIGNVKGIPDSSIVMLRTKNINLDSALVLNEKFELTGSIDEPVKVFLIIPSTNDYLSFWIENIVITFDAEAGKFTDAQIKGSPLQTESEMLLAKFISFRKTTDSLGALLSTGSDNVDKNSILEKIKEIEKTAKQEEYLFVKNNPASLIAATTLDVMKTAWGKEKVKPLYEAFSDEIKKSSYGKTINEYLKLSVNPKIGEKYVDFESTDLNVKKIRLSDINAKVLLLDFWAANCFPCREENKILVKIYNDYKKFGFEIFSVSGDTNREAWVTAMKEDKLIWANVFDGDGTNSKPFLIYGINGIPDNFLINSEGIIVARNLRGDDLKKKLNELLK